MVPTSRNSTRSGAVEGCSGEQLWQRKSKRIKAFQAKIAKLRKRGVKAQDVDLAVAERRIVTLTINHSRLVAGRGMMAEA
ncbi:MAG TPA: hypothetical protein VHH73_03970 [Verrucomicrobiae bacterium]|nr:hypothetical protein [Verrucomicrobiae bacterium]